MQIGFLGLVIVLVIGWVYFHRHPGTASRAQALRNIGFGLMAFQAVFIGAFVVAESLADPGGLASVLLIVSWLLPLVAFVLFAWFRPGAAFPVLAVLTGAVVAVTVWAAVQADSWRAFEDRNGPIRTIVAFALATAIAVYGLRRTREAGWLLVVLGAIPLLLSTFGGRATPGSLAVAVTPVLIVGVLYLISAHLGDGATPAPPPRPRDHVDAG